MTSKVIEVFGHTTSTVNGPMLSAASLIEHSREHSSGPSPENYATHNQCGLPFHLPVNRQVDRPIRSRKLCTEIPLCGDSRLYQVDIES